MYTQQRIPLKGCRPINDLFIFLPSSPGCLRVARCRFGDTENWQIKSVLKQVVKKSETGAGVMRWGPVTIE